jgi:hypothetical protein
MEPIYSWKNRQSEQPTWDEVQATSEVTKDYWSQLPALKMKNEVLYRRFYDNHGLVAHLQPIVPRSLREDIILHRVHTGMTGGHF